MILRAVRVQIFSSLVGNGMKAAVDGTDVHDSRLTDNAETARE